MPFWLISQKVLATHLPHPSAAMLPKHRESQSPPQQACLPFGRPMSFPGRHSFPKAIVSVPRVACASDTGASLLGPHAHMGVSEPLCAPSATCLCLQGPRPCQGQRWLSSCSVASLAPMAVLADGLIIYLTGIPFLSYFPWDPRAGPFLPRPGASTAPPPGPQLLLLASLLLACLCSSTTFYISSCICATAPFLLLIGWLWMCMSAAHWGWR